MVMGVIFVAGLVSLYRAFEFLSYQNMYGFVKDSEFRMESGIVCKSKKTIRVSGRKEKVLILNAIYSRSLNV